MDDLSLALERAHEHATSWLTSLERRTVPGRASVAEVVEALGTTLPDGPTPAAEVVDLLAGACEPGLTAMPSGRFFGFVIGGTHPAGLAADWLVTAWDQNSGLRLLTPAASAAEEVASAWLLDLLGLPPESAVGFVTGGTMANFCGLLTGRDTVLRRVGWDVARDGLAGAPRVRVLVGAERHDTVDLTLRYLGLGAPEALDVDDQGRVAPESLDRALAEAPDVPTLVALQAGNVHSGAFDPFGPLVESAHRHGAWVHVDGAFGLWAAASPAYAALADGMARADSWATDAHKTLNVPYDSGLAIVRDAAAMRASLGVHADYLIHDEAGEPLDKTPELSRRARGIPVWAVLRALGRSGVADLVERLVGHARALADGVAAIPGTTVLNDVVFTQVCVSFGDDARTEEVVRRVLADGEVWMSGSRWHGRSVLRIAVSNWSTTDHDVARSLDAVRRAASASGPSGEQRP